MIECRHSLVTYSAKRELKIVQVLLEQLKVAAWQQVEGRTPFSSSSNKTNCIVRRLSKPKSIALQTLYSKTPHRV